MIAAALPVTVIASANAAMPTAYDSPTAHTMRRILSSIVLAASLALAPPSVMAKGTSGTHTASSTHTATGTHAPSSKSAAPHASPKTASAKNSSAAKPKSGKHNSDYAQGVQRDAKGKIARSPKAKADFKNQHPCPSTGKTSGACPGYVIDHVQALKHGGADKASNMQWQTTAAAKQKDKTE